MNAQQLRNSILQEAIEGRLVPQDPNDEPASVLLERIREEKKRLVKEGKLKKKDLEEKPISEDEKPFEIPDSWEWVRLKYIVSLLGDGIHGTPEYDVTGNYYFINGNNLSNNKIIIKNDTKKVNETEYLKYRKELSDKTILVSINGTIGNVGHYNGEPVILGKSACYFNLIDINLKDYITLLMYTDYFLQYATENATGSTIKNVSLAVMNSFIIPLPPLAEQKRIVAKIEELLPKVEEYGKAQEALDKLNKELPERLKKSILQEAISGRLVPQDPNDEPASVLLDKIRQEKVQLVKEGKLKKKDLIETPITDDEKPFDIPDSWEWVRLANVGTTETGTTPSKSHPEYFGSFIPFLGPANIINGIIVSETQGLSEIGIKYGRVVPADTILQVCIGGSIGKCAISDKSVTFNQQINSVTPIECAVKYVYFVLQSKQFLLSLIDNSTGTATPIINRGNWEQLPIPLPPLAEQKRIVKKIEELFAEIDKLK